MRRSIPRVEVLILSVVFFIAQPVSLEAQTKLTGQSAMKFLSIGVGARAAGLGYSFITNTDDVSSIFWNPAGIATLGGTRAFVDINQWISDIKQISFAASQDLGSFGVLGLSFTTMDYGDIPGTTVSLSAAGEGAFEYIETGNIKVGNYALGLAYARAISSEFSVGGQVKYVYSGLGSNTIVLSGNKESIDNTVSTFAFDFGTTYNTGFHGLTFSMSLRNFSAEIRYPKMTQGFYLPLVFTLGFSLDVISLVDPSSQKHSLVLSAVGLHPTDYLEKASFGAEYSFDHQYFFRAGYKFNYSIESLALGLGVRVPFPGVDFIQFDYGYSVMEYFGGVHRLSLSGAF